jgi:hypothetical protein
MTALAGLPTYLDWAAVSGLTASIERPRKGCAGRSQGWTDRPIVMAWVLLNLAGGECVEDLRVLEGPVDQDGEGFARVLRRVETYGLPRKERRCPALKRCFGIWPPFMTRRKSRSGRRDGRLSPRRMRMCRGWDG